MNLEDSLFAVRTKLGVPFSRKRVRHLPLLQEWAKSAVSIPTKLDDVFPEYDLSALDADVKRFARYMQIAGPDSNFAHGHVIAASIEKLLRERESVNCLDLGSAKGFSAACMSLACANFERKPSTVISVDHLPADKRFFWGTESDLVFGRVSRNELVSQVSDEIYSRINFVTALTNDFLKNNKKRFHLVFVDAGHDYKSVATQLKFCLDFQRTGDIIVLDDYNGKYSGVTRAVNEFAREASGYLLSEISSSESRSYAILSRGKLS